MVFQGASNAVRIPLWSRATIDQQANCIGQHMNCLYLMKLLKSLFKRSFWRIQWRSGDRFFSEGAGNLGVILVLVLEKELR